MRRVNQAAIVENKRLGQVLAYVAEQQKLTDTTAARRLHADAAKVRACSRWAKAPISTSCRLWHWTLGRRPLRNHDQLRVRATFSPGLVVTFLTSADCDLSIGFQQAT
jgi:hypothetical protein